MSYKPNNRFNKNNYLIMAEEMFWSARMRLGLRFGISKLFFGLKSNAFKNITLEKRKKKIPNQNAPQTPIRTRTLQQRKPAAIREVLQNISRAIREN